MKNLKHIKTFYLIQIMRTFTGLLIVATIIVVVSADCEK